MTVRVRGVGLDRIGKPDAEVNSLDQHWFIAYLPKGDSVTVTLPSWSHIQVVVDSADPRFACILINWTLGDCEVLLIRNSDFLPEPEREGLTWIQKFMRCIRCGCCNFRIPFRRNANQQNDMEDQQGEDVRQGEDQREDRREDQQPEQRRSEGQPEERGNENQQEERRSEDQPEERRSDDQQEERRGEGQQEGG